MCARLHIVKHQLSLISSLFLQKLYGLCFTLYCPVGTPPLFYHHYPLPLRTPALSGALCCQASCYKTATVGGRECGSWKDERERERGRQAGQQLPLFTYSQQKLMWIHLLNGRPMISRPRLVLCSPNSPLSQRIGALCADLPENLPCYGSEVETIRDGSSPRKKALCQA